MLSRAFFVGHWSEGTPLKLFGHPALQRTPGAPWTSKEVLTTIRRCHAAKLPLNAKAYTATSLYTKAREYFGSWRNAVWSALHIPYEELLGVRFWTAEQVLEVIRSERRAGRPLAICSINERIKGFRGGVHRHWGTYKKALRAIGLSPGEILDKRHRWSAPLVLARLRKLGRTMNAQEILTRHPSLRDLARTYCGGWKAAYLAAQVPSAPRHCKWTRDQILTTLRKADRRGTLMRSTSFPDTFRAAVKYRFRRWSYALEAAQIPVPDRAILWSRAMILREIRRRARATGRAVGRGLGVQGAAQRRFGSWRNACRVAGVLPAPSGRPRKR